MSLSADLISQFVKTTTDKKETNKESTSYGTVVIDVITGATSVRLDGSDILTPVSTTTLAKNGDRVMVTIKNHSATITGNLSDPATSSGSQADITQMASKITEFEIAIGTKVSTELFDAQVARIDQLKSENVTIQGILSSHTAFIEELQTENVTISEKLTANEASIENLQATKLDVDIADAKYALIDDLEATNIEVNNLKGAYGNFAELTAGTIEAMEAEILDLQTKKLSATDIEGKYANIDFSNISKATMQWFYANSGLINNVVVGDGTITGELVGVTIKGDLIEGGTVKADKLVIKGTDGLYYKLNTDGVKTEKDQTEYNSINGSVILAKSITATKINVSDLVAFGATIGGFHITDESIYSGTKSTVDNTTRGVYLDSTGQMAVGDASNFLKFYEDIDGNYKLVISASSVVFATSNKSVETAIDDLRETLSVSGRNLIIRRGERLNTYVLASGTVAECEASYRSATVLDPIKIEGGQTYTFSKDESAVEYFRWAWYDKDMNVIGRTADNASVFTWTAPENASYVIVSYPYTQGSNVKMEKGDTATAYSPAIEDVGDIITSMDTRLTETINTKVDGIEIGGRNLIKNSNFASGIDKWTPVGVTYSIDTDSKHGTYVKIESTKAGHSEQRIYPDTVGNFNHSRSTYTLSFYAKTDEACTLQTNIAGGTTGVKNYELTTEWTKYTHTYNCTSTGSLTFWLNDANTTAYITKIKLEVGNKATDWTPAPEDMATSEEVQKAQSSADDAKTLSDNAIALIAQLSDNISMLVTDGNGTSLMKQTDEGWTFSTADIQDLVNSTSEGLSDLTNEVGEVNGAVDVLKQAVSDLGVIAEYVKIGTYGTEVITPLMVNDYMGYYYVYDNKKYKLVSPEEILMSFCLYDGRGIDLYYRLSLQSDELDLDESDSLTFKFLSCEPGPYNEGYYTYETVLVTYEINGVFRQAIAYVEDMNQCQEGNPTVELDEIEFYAREAYLIEGEIEPCIELGESDSDFKLRITNTRMMFTEGSEVLAYFNNQSLHIKKAVVEEELQQGGFVWKIRSNGNLGLIWKGGNT